MTDTLDLMPAEEVGNLTDWANEPTVRQLKQDFDDAKPSRDTAISTIDTYLNNMHITGAAKMKKEKGRSNIQPKLIRKQAEWRYAALSEPFLSTPDLYKVDPVTWEDKKGAYENQLVLNNQFNTQLNKVAFIDEYVRTAVDEGTVIVKVGWEFEEEEQEVEIPNMEYVRTDDLNIVKMHQAIHMQMQQNPDFWATIPPEVWQSHLITMETGFPHQAVPSEPTYETQMVTIKNQPSLEICNYKNITIDPSCNGKIDKAKFVIYSFETSRSDLEAEGDRYSNLEKINIEGSSVLSTPDHTSSDNSNFNFSEGDPRKKFVAHEYWGYWDVNGDGKLVPIVATYVGDVMIRMEENPFPDKKLPFIVEQYLPVRRAIYGESDGALLEDNQRVLGATIRGMVDIMGRSANSQQGIRKDALDTVNKRRFEAGKDYEYNASVRPEDVFHMHTYPEIPNSAITMLTLQNQEAESLTGVKAFSGGISGESLGKVATGVRGALDAASKRELGILRRLSNGIIEIGKKIIAMNSQWLSDEEIIRVTNEEFVTVQRDHLAGRYDLALTISTAEADEAKAQELAFMLQTTAQTLPFELTQTLLVDIAKLRKMPDLAKKIEEFQPQPDPKQDLEMQLLQVQIAKEQAAAQENMAQAELFRARAQKELAEAGKKMSEKDKIDLDYVEQETGTKHARDEDLVNSQAESNSKMKVLEHNLKMAEKAEDRLQENIDKAIDNAPA